MRDEAGEPEGRLLESWEHSEDCRGWTLHLRIGLEWEDGVRVTAHDVAFSLNLLAHPAVLMHEPGSFLVEVVDDSTYRIELLQPATAGTAHDLFRWRAPSSPRQDADDDQDDLPEGVFPVHRRSDSPDAKSGQHELMVFSMTAS